MHITRDGGEDWEDITPPDLPKFSRVSIIEESRHNPGTAYLAANRYQVDDRTPYVYRTRDYGALVHNSRSRSTIVLYSRIRGSP